MALTSSRGGVSYLRQSIRRRNEWQDIDKVRVESLYFTGDMEESRETDSNKLEDDGHEWWSGEGEIWRLNVEPRV